MTTDEIEVLDEGKPGGVFELDNISGTEFLQQMYYMCEGRAAAMAEDPRAVGTVIAFDGIDGDQLYMMLFPFVPEEEFEEDDVRTDNISDPARGH